MVDLKKVYFGCADANTEAERRPDTFKKVFFDPHNYLEELTDGDRYILRGKKGDGKTAYGAQISLTAPSREMYTCQRTLNNFNNATFLKIKTYEALGGNPYISFWKCVLLIECVRMINQNEPNIQAQKFIDIVDALRANGFLATDNDISVTVTKLVESNSALSIKGFFQHNRKYESDTELHGAEEIYAEIKKAIENVYLTKKFLLIVDGLDDILNNSEFKAEIITGLIRAVDEINRSFRKTTLSLKILILIRDDILNLCRDPNLSKIVRDSGIRLQWNITGDPFESDLMQLVERRIDDATGNCAPCAEVWKDIFPEKIAGRPAIDYVLDNIIYRPRDILQFFIEIQKEFAPNRKLSEEKVQTALARYSIEYFVDAMRDELTGFFLDDAVTVLPDVLSKMGTKYFYLCDLEKECDNYAIFKDVPVRAMLEKLFNAGYIGQRRPREKKDYIVFSYRNPRESFQEEHECILHRGLMRALTI